MAEEFQVAAFEGGQLRRLSSGGGGREVVLALPLNRLVARVVRVPADRREDPEGYAAEVLKAMSPFPDEPLTVSCETVREDGEGLVVIAAALPEGATDDLAEALDAQKLNVTRVDALVLGAVRGLWEALGASAGVRKLLLFGTADCLSALVVDGESPCALRALSPGGDLRREVMLTLLEAEDFAGPRALAECVCVGMDGEASAPLAAFAPVRRLELGEDAALVGVAARSAEAGTLNALPESWRAELDETRFRGKLKGRLVAAGVCWALLAAVVFGTPFVLGVMADRQKDLCRDHSRQYGQVRDMKDKVDLVRKYSDHTRGALEIMKAVSDRLPQGIELDTWSFRREEGVKVSGLADAATQVYAFKDNMVATGTEGADGEADEGSRVFASVELNGPSAGKNGKQKFDLECRYRAEEEE